jgi:hypothetical protein
MNELTKAVVPIVLALAMALPSQAQNNPIKDLKAQAKDCTPLKLLQDQNSISASITKYLKAVEVKDLGSLVNATFTSLVNDSVTYYSCLGQAARPNEDLDQIYIDLNELVTGVSNALQTAMNTDGKQADKIKVITDARNAATAKIATLSTGDRLTPKLDNQTIQAAIPVKILTSTTQISAGVTLAWQSANIKADFGKKFPETLSGDALAAIENFNRVWRNYVQGSIGTKALKSGFIGPLYDAAATALNDTIKIAGADTKKPVVKDSADSATPAPPANNPPTSSGSAPVPAKKK